MALDGGKYGKGILDSCHVKSIITGFTESLKEIGYQGIRKGDLVIHVMDAFAGSIGVCKW